jgi:AcrR family transcriptional regulator
MKRQIPDLAAKKQPKQGRAKATVEALLDSAARILKSGGYAALTTNRVAEVAGVSIGSVYEYFPNKQALLAAVAGRALEGIVEDTAQGMAEMFQLPDQQQAYRKWFEILVKALEKRRGILRVMRHEAPFLADIPENRRANQALLEIATLGRRQAEAAGRVQAPFRDADASMFLLTAMVGAAIERIAFDPPKHLERERLLDTLTEMVGRLL